MKKVWEKYKNAGNEGFTLVEVIVVLVILAILAAVSIPALTGFIKESNQKSYVAEARTAYVAAQAYVTEKLSTDTTATAATVQAEFADKDIADCPTKFKNYMEDSFTSGAKMKSITITGTKLTQIVYYVNSTTITITPGSGAVIS